MTSNAKPDYRLDHVCLAVRKLAPAREMLERTLGYRPRTEPVTNTRQKVTVQFMSKAGSMDIKLIEPSTPESPLVEFIKTRGGGLHHLAFRTKSVAAGVLGLEAAGAKVIAAPQPGEAFGDSPIAFMFLNFGLSIELVETDERSATVPVDATRGDR
jgi:4-hydroxyphenylpyruvate dioxygenase-like putative hemolysin